MENSSLTSLKTALAGNAIFSALSAAFMILFGTTLAPLFGLQQPTVLYIIAVGLLLNAGNLLNGAKSKKLRKKIGRIAIAGDLLWVFGTVVLLLIDTQITSLGRWLLIGVADIVLIFALWQINTIVDTSGSIQRVRRIDEPVEIVWQTVADVEGYAKHAPNLAETTIVDGKDKGMIRQCTDTSGNSWTEKCTVWEEEKQYTFKVNADEINLPLNMFQGTFGIDEENGMTVMKMRFDYVAKYGLIGKIMVHLGKSRSFDLIDSTLDSWENEIRQKTETIAEKN